MMPAARNRAEGGVMDHLDWRQLVAGTVLFVVLLGFVWFCLVARFWPAPLISRSAEEPAPARLQKLREELTRAERQFEELTGRRKKQ
jgi:hypothetical protein